MEIFLNISTAIGMMIIIAISMVLIWTTVSGIYSSTLGKIYKDVKADELTKILAQHKFYNLDYATQQRIRQWIRTTEIEEYHETSF